MGREKQAGLRSGRIGNTLPRNFNEVKEQMSMTQEIFQNISNGNRHFKNADLSAIDASEYFEKDFFFENCQFFNVNFNGITIEKFHACHFSAMPKFQE